MGRFLTDEAWGQCCPDRTLGLWKELVNSFGRKIDTASLMRADLWTYLSENCLAKTDRASMAHSLEVRVPMLDNEVLDTVLRLPSEVHFDPAGKSILRALAARHLPEQVWNRPKHGFSVPLQNNFNGQWHDVCSDYVGRTSAIAPFLDHQAVNNLWQDACRGRGSRRLAYTFIVLLIWLEKHMLQ